MVKKVQVPTLLSRAMFSGKPGPSGPRTTETPVCPADPALALHQIWGYVVYDLNISVEPLLLSHMGLVYGP